ncbi:MAG: sirohydrochlorin cobaltochelatase [Lachnospiraceae bacterium]|jgi:cobalamin biosynthesis Co2+ chelatase CbiK|nr:sirohydrochlorin cobaltochelatase [Lachnospiraceae bacterium]
MEHKTKKAILVVSFGTTFHRTREKTIDKIEEEIQAAYPEYELYRAWTSKMIIAKLLRRDGIRVPTVTEAVEAMLADGITELVVQPTHIINGVENDQMKADVQEYRDRFLRVVFGNPLLTTTEDSQEAIQAVMAEFPELDTKDALVFMGHGTTHYANTVYAALDYTFKDLGYPHVFLGTVEAYPSLESLMKMVQSFAPRRVLLAPFMVVAGDHAIHDMSGEDQDSWRSQFEKAGFKVECFMKGLGEYAGIRRMYVQHVADALAGDACSQQTI